MSIETPVGIAKKKVKNIELNTIFIPPIQFSLSNVAIFVKTNYEKHKKNQITRFNNLSLDSSVFSVNHLAQCMFIEKYYDDVYTVKTTSHCECQLVIKIHCIKKIIICVNYSFIYSMTGKTTTT